MIHQHLKKFKAISATKEGNTRLGLRGLGLLRYRMFIKAYAAALYLGPGVPVGRVLEDVPKRLEIEYFWNLSARKIAEAGERIGLEPCDDGRWRVHYAWIPIGIMELSKFEERGPRQFGRLIPIADPTPRRRRRRYGS